MKRIKILHPAVNLPGKQFAMDRQGSGGLEKIFAEVSRLVKKKPRLYSSITSQQENRGSVYLMI